jgi:hypothetical protein
MKLATQLLNLLALIIVIITGLYIHIKFDNILTVKMIIFLWIFIALFGAALLEKEFNIKRKTTNL